ncbi:hypothetical protein PV327_005111 [Microctonus hyperodae]|uniref:Uncharacterized protein n=1 Tax=Microctonus hyperodae TaxID=165561 RepID=A0AA39G118_MICHY|nr:hypothetical protein PV327_005111 [Microctonus hyperodae]
MAFRDFEIPVEMWPWQRNHKDSKSLQEVLLVEPDHYEWIKPSNATVRKNAVEGGNIVGDEIIYECQIHGPTYYTGWVVLSNCKIGRVENFEDKHNRCLVGIGFE